MKALWIFVMFVSLVGVIMILLSSQLPYGSAARGLTTILTVALVLMGSAVAWAIYRRQK